MYGRTDGRMDKRADPLPDCGQLIVILWTPALGSDGGGPTPPAERVGGPLPPPPGGLSAGTNCCSFLGRAGGRRDHHSTSAPPRPHNYQRPQQRHHHRGGGGHRQQQLYQGTGGFLEAVFAKEAGWFEAKFVFDRSVFLVQVSIIQTIKKLKKILFKIADFKEFQNI